MITYQNAKGEISKTQTNSDVLGTTQSRLQSKGYTILKVESLGQGKNVSKSSTQTTTTSSGQTTKNVEAKHEGTGYVYYEAPAPTLPQNKIEVFRHGGGEVQKKTEYTINPKNPYEVLGTITTTRTYADSSVKAIPIKTLSQGEFNTQFSLLPEPAKIAMNVTGTLLSGIQRTIGGLAEDISSRLGYQMIPLKNSPLPFVVIQNKNIEPTHSLVTVWDSGLNPKNLSEPSLQVKDWMYQQQLETNPVKRWIGIQAPTYEYIILPVLGGGALKLVSASLKTAGPVASGIIRGSSAVTQYALLPAAIGIPAGQLAATKGIQSKESVEFLLSTGIQFAMFGTAYKGTNILAYERFETRMGNFGKNVGQTIGRFPVMKEATLNINAFKAENLTFKSGMQSFKSEFYNPTEVMYRMRYDQDSFGNPPTFFEEARYNIGQNVKGMKQPFVDFKTSFTKRFHIGELSFENRPEITRQYIDSGYRVTETKYGETFVKKVDLIPYKKGFTVKTGGSTFELSPRVSVISKSQNFYKGMGEWGLPSEPMLLGRKAVQVNFFGEAIFENQRVNLSEDFLKWQNRMETKILEQKLSEMNEMKAPKEKIDWYTYGKEKVNLKNQPFEVIKKESLVSLKTRPYYHSMEKWGLPSEAMTNEKVEWGNTNKNILKGTFEDTLKGASKDTGLEISYEEALSNMGRVSKEDLRITKNYDITKYGTEVGKKVTQTNLNIKNFKPEIIALGKKSSVMKFYNAMDKLGLPSEDMGITKEIRTKNKDLFMLLEKPYGEKELISASGRSGIDFDTSYLDTKVSKQYLEDIEYGIVNASNYWKTSNKSSQDNISSLDFRTDLTSNIKKELSDFRMETGLLSGNISLNIQDLSRASIQSSEQASLQQQVQIQQLDFKLDFEQDRVTWDKQGEITTIIPTFFLPRDGGSEGKRKKKKEFKLGGKGFNVFVKTRHYFHGKKIGSGGFKRINFEPLTKESALSLLGTRLKMTAAATGKIELAEGPAVEKNMGYNWNAIANQFYNKGENVYVQKKQYRMGTKSELRDITGSDWLSAKGKGISFNLSKGKMRLKI